jgi:hypothetical protein
MKKASMRWCTRAALRLISNASAGLSAARDR